MTADHAPASETFTFVCGHCGLTWDVLFRVTSFTGRGGSAGRAYVDERGRVLTTPLARAHCPDCGGRDVRVLAPELAARVHAAEHALHARARVRAPNGPDRAAPRP